MTATSPKSSVAFHALLALSLAPAAAMVFLWPTASAQTPAKTAYASVLIETGAGQGADALRIQQSRITAAVRSVCSSVAIHSPLDPREQSNCRRETTARTMRQLVEMSAGIAVASANPAAQ